LEERDIIVSYQIKKKRKEEGRLAKREKTPISSTNLNSLILLYFDLLFNRHAMLNSFS
jgi:hypothetical protein